MQRIWIFPILLGASILMTACEKEEETPEIVEPPPPTPAEIAQRIISELSLDAPIPPPGASVPPGAAAQWLSKVQSTVASNSATEDGQEALGIVSRRLDQRVRTMEDNEMWDSVVILCEGHTIFNPGSTRFARTREVAEIELRKPKIKVMFIVKNENIDKITGRLSFYLPLTGETYQESMRLGEERHGCKLVAFINNEKGVELEYLETGELMQFITGS